MITGIIGLISSTIFFFIQLDDKDSTFIPILAWGFFFGLITYATIQIDKPKPPMSIQQLIKKEYTRCLDSYSSEVVLKETKASKEKLCVEATELYKQNILTTKPKVK